MDTQDSTNTGMVRSNFYISKEHHDIMNSASRIKGKSKSEILRDALEMYAAAYNNELDEFISGFADGFKSVIKFIPLEEMVAKWIDQPLEDAQIAICRKIDEYGFLAIKKPRSIGMSKILLVAAIHKAALSKQKIYFSLPADRGTLEAMKIIRQFKSTFPTLVNATNVHGEITLANGSTIKFIIQSQIPYYVRGVDGITLFVDEYNGSDETTDAILDGIQIGRIKNLYIGSNPNQAFLPIWETAILPTSKLRGVSVTWDALISHDAEWRTKMRATLSDEAFDIEHGGKFPSKKVSYDIIGNPDSEGYYIKPMEGK